MAVLVPVVLVVVLVVVTVVVVDLSPITCRLSTSPALQKPLHVDFFFDTVRHTVHQTTTTIILRPQQTLF